MRASRVVIMAVRDAAGVQLRVLAIAVRD